MKTKVCPSCKQEFEGRRNKKFCNVECKNSFHNGKYREVNNVVYNTNKILHSNRKILKQLFKIYRSSAVPLNVLEAYGYDMKFHTHLFEAPSGVNYTMVYEVGFKKAFDNQINIIELEE